MTIDFKNYSAELNTNRGFQKAFLVELEKLEVSYVQEDDTGEETTRKITEQFPDSAFKKDFTTTDVEKWPRRYLFDAQLGYFLNADDCTPVRLLDEFRELATALEESEGLADLVAASCLDLNPYGFQSSELKTPMMVGKGADARLEETWDFNKFSDVLVSHLTFRAWERTLTTGKIGRDLFLYTDAGGYTPFGSNEMGTMLKVLGVPDDKIWQWAERLPMLIMNHPNVPKFGEWNTKLIACRNGVLDPWTLTLRPHSPDDLVKNRLLADWNPDAVHPMADELFAIISDVDDRNLVLGMLAVTLVGNKRRNFFVQKGVTGTGKSTVTEIWKAAVLGNALSTTFYAQHTFGDGDAARFGLIRFDTACMAVCDDLTGQRIKDSGMLKTVTSGGTISIQYKGRDSYDALARAVVILNSNDVPNFEDRSGAILDRAVFINRDAVLDKDKRIDFSRFVNEDAFRSRLLFLVMDAFQEMRVQEDDGTWSYRLPPESVGGRALREIAKNKGTAVISAFKRLLSLKRIIGMTVREIEDDLAEVYEDINTIDYKAMGRDALNNALHSIGVDEKFRLQLYSKSGTGKLTLIQKKGEYQKAWSPYVSGVVAFSSLDATERELWGKYAVMYSKVMSGEAVARCNEIAEHDPESAVKEWAKFREAYDFTLAKVEEYDPEAVEVYEATADREGVVPKELDFHAARDEGASA